MLAVPWIPSAVVAICAIVAGIFDVWKFRVPNAVTFPLVVSGVVYQSWFGGLSGLQSSVLGAAVGFGVLFAFYLIGGMGAGDVKLMAGIGAWLGVSATANILLVAALAAGAYSVLVMAWAGSIGDTLIRAQVVLVQLATIGRHFGVNDTVQSLARQPDRRKRAVPFAAMIAIGALVVLFVSAFFASTFQVTVN